MKTQKHKKWLLISLVSLFVIFCTSFLLAFVLYLRYPQQVFSFSSYTESPALIQEQEYSLEGITGLDIENTMADLSIEAYEGEKLHILYEAMHGSTLNANPQSGILYVKAIHASRPLIGGLSPSYTPKLRIRIPHSRKDLVLSVQNDVGNFSLYSEAKSLNIQNNVGDLELFSSLEELHLQSDVGNVDIEGSLRSYSHISANVGDVEFRASVSQNSIHEISADVGDVQIYLPEDADVSLFAKSDFGSLVSDFAVNADSPEENTARKEDGNSERIYVNVRTDLGTIHIQKR